MRIATSFITYIVCITALFAQQDIKITGRIFDAETNAPLPGASIFMKGTRADTVSNFEGEFEYFIPANAIKKPIIIISYLGYETQKISVGNTRNFLIYLQPNAEFLDEVIITSSYGTSKPREEVVGSISQIIAKDIVANQSFESVDKMIEGLAPGIQIVGNTQIGTATTINIRGQGSFSPLNNNQQNTSTQPLIIVDGIQLTEEQGFDSPQFSGATRFGEEFLNPLAKILPESIERISILKDASAVSIYGADGANGVILITTKKGRSRKPKFNISYQSGISSAINKIEYLSGSEYYQLLLDYHKNDGNSTGQAQALAGPADINTDWFKLLNNTGSFTRTQFNVSGRTEKFHYRSSLSYLDTEEVQKGNSFNNLSGSLAVGYNDNGFSADLRFTPSLIHKKNPNTLFNFALRPTISPFQNDGSFTIIEDGIIGNPLAVLNQNISDAKTFGFLTSLNVGYEITKQLKVRGIFGVDFTEKTQDRFFSGSNNSGRLTGNFVKNGVTFPNWGRKILYERDVRKYTANANLNYQNTFLDKHTLDGIVGFEIIEGAIIAKRAFGTGYVEQNKNNTLEEANKVKRSSFTSENALVSIFTQANYNFDKRYFITASIRQDQNSVFGGDVDAAYNGAVGGSWVMSNEQFLKGKNIEFLRFRLSYGSSGNSRIGSYTARGLYDVNADGLDGYNSGNFALPVSAPNNNLSWERNYKTNAGFDLKIFNERIHLAMDVYRDRITDIISSTNIIPEIGFSSVQANTGSMRNQGIEIAWKSIFIDTPTLKWTVDLNFSKNQNKILSLTNLSSEFSTSTLATALRVGESTTAIWGVVWEGVDPATGRNLYSKNGEIYDGATYKANFNNADWEIIGNRLPDFYGGVRSQFSFKDFSASVRFLYSYGDDILISRDLESTDQLIMTRNMISNVSDYWKKPGDLVRNSRPGPGQPVSKNSTKYIYDNSRIKFQNISLGYHLPEEIIRPLHINDISVFVNVDNIAYWYKEKALGQKNGVAALRFTYPESRTITLGVSLDF